MGERDAAQPHPEGVDLLRSISARIRAGQAPHPRETEQQLESGFGRLVALEAQLRSARDAGVGDDGSSAPRVPELERSLEALREAVTELRMVSSAGDLPRIGYGFVLPGRPWSSRRRE